ncbi:MAG: NAD(P)H-quinone oxidoreductase subunit M [Rhodobacter sp.]|nr:NAD(P)H-quinone oxidoreductase subunit M [Rhodobacter sp.]
MLGDIIGATLDWQKDNPDKDMKSSEKIIDEVIDTFDDLIAKIHAKDVENKKQHFKSIGAELEERGRKLIDKLNAL